MASVTFENIAKSYGVRTILSGLNLRVEDGECFTLLGPSGCGKTVLLRLLAGFEAPDSGRVLIDGQPVSDTAAGLLTAPNERNLGVVFQDYAVWPHMTVFENVAYPLKLAGKSRQEREERVRESVAHVNMTGLEDRLPSQLSGGQQQRVALARALTAKPSLLLLDEPLCNLDAHLREEMRFEIKALQKNLGITVFYVTHDQEIALAISDRLAVMDATGTIRQIGAPEEVYERPVSPYVFNFLGMANFIPLHAERGVLRLEGGQTLRWADAPADGGGYVAGCRPSDVCLSRGGDGLRGVVQRASFLGASTDFLIDLDGVGVRTQLETHQALEQGLLFAEGEPCVVTFQSLTFFDKARHQEDVL